MNCKEEENVNKFTIYCCWMELTVVRPVGPSSRGLGWGRMSERRLPAHERPRDSFLLPQWKEQTFHSATGRNLPCLLFLQGWLFVGKGTWEAQRTWGLEKDLYGSSVCSGRDSLDSWDRKGSADDLLLSHHPPLFREEQAVRCHGKLQRPKVGTPLPGDISIFNFIPLLNLFWEI